MDFAKQIAELESLVRIVATAARTKYAYSAEIAVQHKIDIWRQATAHKLEDAYLAGYDAALSQVSGGGYSKSGNIGEPQ